MQICNNTKIVPPLLQWNGHLQTILPSYFRQNHTLSYQREKLVLKDGDFINLDWLLTGNDTDCLIILSHGLEGDSNRHYIKFQAELLFNNGYNVLAWNCRSCGGELNLLPKLYYHGDIDDIAELVEYVASLKGFKKIILAGFSMGGNIVLNYAASRKLHSSVIAIAAVSFPGHLKSCVEKMETSIIPIYSHKFRRSLNKKLRLKAVQHPNWLDFEKLDKIKSWHEFDQIFSAPMTNHATAEDFYEASSSILRIHQIPIPTLMIQAANDPILSDKSIPTDLTKYKNSLELCVTKKGGHLGFMLKNQYFTWSEMKILNWISDMCKIKK